VDPITGLNLVKPTTGKGLTERKEFLKIKLNSKDTQIPTGYHGEKKV